MTARRLRLGIAGLGRGFMLMLPTLRTDSRLAVVAAADPRPEARRQFEVDFGGRAYDSVDALCADRDVEAIYVATPHELHAANAIAAARAGKHLLVEKPMAVTLAECDAMNAAARAAGVVLVVGPSHSFDAPIARTKTLVDSGTYGRVRMITALNYTDFLYRPRRPEELDTRQGGGVVFSQGAHQVDVARLLAGSPVQSVRAVTGAWDPARPTEGAYTALLTFANGVCASLTYSGYAHFDSDALMGWVGEMGHRKDPDRYWTTRAATLKAGSPEAEAALKNTRAYGSATASASAPAVHGHFGLVIVSCEHADLQPMPDAVHVHADDRRTVVPVPPTTVPRVEVIDELYGAVVDGRAPVHDGEWSRDTLAAAIAILQSAREGREVGPQPRAAG